MATKKSKSAKLKYSKIAIVFTIFLIVGGILLFIKISYINSSQEAQKILQNKDFPPKSIQFETILLTFAPTDWLLYDNKDLNFLLKYPADKWTRKVGVSDSLWTNDESAWVNISMSTGRNFKETIEDHVKASKTSGLYNKIISMKYISLGNKRGILYEIEEIPNNKFYSEVILFDEAGMAKERIIYTAIGEDKFNKYKSDYLEILSTFQNTQ